MLLTLPAQIGTFLMIAVCTFALWGGGRPQRIVAATVLLGGFLSAATQDRTFHSVQHLLFLIDVAAMIVFMAAAVTWRNAWLIWVAAFQLLAMATHIAAGLDKRIFSLAYITAYMIWSYLLLAALAWGGAEGWLERRRRSR